MAEQSVGSLSIEPVKRTFLPQVAWDGGLPSWKHGGEEKDDSERTAQLTREILEDLQLTERVERALRSTGYGPLRDVEISVNAGVVLLLGRVPSYFLKQIAQAAALAVPEAHQIHNGLEVGPADAVPQS
jgi:osmotically-inducible protein OsmY